MSCSVSLLFFSPSVVLLTETQPKNNIIFKERHLFHSTRGSHKNRWILSGRSRFTDKPCDFFIINLRVELLFLINKQINLNCIILSQITPTSRRQRAFHRWNSMTLSNVPSNYLLIKQREIENWLSIVQLTRFLVSLPLTQHFMCRNMEYFTRVFVFGGIDSGPGRRLVGCCIIK